MDRKPLVATEASLNLLEDYSHEIETLPNISVLLQSLLTAQANMDVTDTQSTTTKEQETPNEVKGHEEATTNSSPTPVPSIAAEPSQETKNTGEVSTEVKESDSETSAVITLQHAKPLDTPLTEDSETRDHQNSDHQTTNETADKSLAPKEITVSKDVVPSENTKPASGEGDLKQVASSTDAVQHGQSPTTKSPPKPDPSTASPHINEGKAANEAVKSPVPASTEQPLQDKETVTKTEGKTAAESPDHPNSKDQVSQDKESGSPADKSSPITAQESTPQGTLDQQSHTTSAKSDSSKTMSTQPQEAIVATTIVKPTTTTTQAIAAALTTEALTSALLATMSSSANPLSVITPPFVAPAAHVPVLKGTLQKTPTTSVSKETLKFAGAEMLRAEQAEILQNAADLLGQKRIEVKTREEISGKAPPQVAVIPPMLSQTPEVIRLMTNQQGQGVLKKGQDGSAVVSVDKTVTIPHTHRAETRTAESKSPHPVARRIWMSSCRPLDPASLERIGVDSKGNVYWYDGGKNMFLSPASDDPAYKPSESELQLVCKSMVQWTAKLKELRMSSDQQADINLAQTIKDHYMSRVRVATQRKPRDVSVIQNLQAVHSGSPSMKQSQMQKQHIVAMSPSDSSKTPQFVQSAFPQGSILVVPHGGSPFHTVLPMFGSTAMIMQQPVAGITAVAGKDSPSASQSTASIAEAKIVSAVAPITGQSSSSDVASEDDKKKKAETEEPKPPAAMVLTNDQAKSLFPTGKQSTVNVPVIVPPGLTGNVLSSLLPNYQQALFYSPVCAMKVQEAVKMGDISFESKSIEISGEVPIRKILIDENKEESSEDIEVTVTVSEKPEKTMSDSKAEPTQPALFEGHSSAEVMSARLLLSLTGRSDMAPHDSRAPVSLLEQKAALSKPLTREEAIAISTPISTSSSARKRKQTPIASAKPSVSDDTPQPAKPKRGRKPKSEEEKAAQKRKTAPKKNAKANTSTPLSTETPIPLKASHMTGAETSQASAGMLQLKASRSSKPMKEYVIETDSETESSSSGSSSSRGESSSESSSDSSSEEEVAQQKRGVSGRGRGRGRGRGGASQKSIGQKKTTSEDSDNDEKKTPKAKRGGRGSAHGRGGATRKAGKKGLEHIVSIPTNLLNSKPTPGKKKKGQEQAEPVDPGKRASTEFAPDVPTDLASLYAKKGGVDLSILSELTQSVSGDGQDGYPSRSKRTCVRVREQITKLQEILGDEAEAKMSPGGSKVKGRGTGRALTGKVSDAGQQDLSGSVTSPKKSKRPAYSQFTHKRRKRKKKSDEEEALWQPARQQPSGEKLSPVYVFSTTWANKAAAAVEEGIFESIVKFHKAQPKGPGYLTLDSKGKKRKKPSPPPKEPSESEQEEEDKEAEEEEEEEVKPPPKRGQRGRAAPKKITTPRGSHKSSARKSPPIPRAFLRSSSRLRKQRNEPEPDEELVSADESSHHTPTPSPPPPPTNRRTRAAAAKATANTRSTRTSRRKQKSPESFTQEDSESEGSPVGKKTDSDHPVDDKRVSEDQTAAKKPKLDDASFVNNSPIGSSPDDPSSRVEPAATSKDEENYTICHGTPGDKNAETESEQESYPRPKGPLPLSNLATTSSEPMVSPDNAGSVTSATRPQQTPTVADQRPLNKGTPTEQPQAQREHWNPNLPQPQFPPGYPSVYNPALHGMAYPTHATPGIHGTNYPYPMPYPWGHSGQIGSSQEHSRHAAHTGEGLPYVRGVEGTAGSPGLTHTAQVSAANAALHQQQRAQMQTARPGFPVDAHTNQAKQPSMDKPALSHPPSFHQLTSPVSGASSPLAHQGFAQSPSAMNHDFHFGSHNHPSAHPHHFPYGFEHSASPLQQMHLWQTPQMQPHHVPQIAGIRPPHMPAHMPAHAGLWYSPTQHMTPFMQGGELHGHYGKKAVGKTSKTLPQDKAGANHNNNNNNSSEAESSTFLNIGPHLANYHAKAFPTSASPRPGSSLEQMLTTTNKNEVANQQALSGSYPLSNTPYYSPNSYE